jgi:hypothetical protein
LSHLPSLGQGIEQTTDRLHDGRINQMGTPEAVGHDRLIFYPANVMFPLNPDDGAQPGIESLLLPRQFLAGHFCRVCKMPDHDTYQGGQFSTLLSPIPGHFSTLFYN